MTLSRKSIRKFILKKYYVLAMFIYSNLRVIDLLMPKIGAKVNLSFLEDDILDKYKKHHSVLPTTLEDLKIFMDEHYCQIFYDSVISGERRIAGRRIQLGVKFLKRTGRL